MKSYSRGELVEAVSLYLRFCAELSRPATLDGYHRWRFRCDPPAHVVRVAGWEELVAEATSSVL